MCSNYQPIKRSRNPWVRDHFNVDLPDGEWKIHTWPKYQSPFIFIDKGIVRCELGKFGLEPIWAGSRQFPPRKTFNARSETVATKQTFRNAWSDRRFGLVLTDKFYEPLYSKGEEEKPEWAGIYRKDGEPAAIAVIWESYFDAKTEQTIRSFSMLTVNAEAHPLMNLFHKPGDEKRSIVIIENKDFETWLHASHEQARELIKIPPDNYLDYEV